MFLSNWEQITADPVVLQAVQGYEIPFSSTPPPRPNLPEPVLSESDGRQCDCEITRLLNKGAIAQVEDSPDQFLSRFFLVEKPSGGVRFIFNLKDLNNYIVPPHFKLEDWRTVVRLMLPHMQMATIDIEDAYLLVPIHEKHRIYLRFRWRGITYQFLALPFGLCTAPYIFTKIIRPIVKYLRERGFESVVYLDDFLLLSLSASACEENVQAHLNLLTSLGFVINFKKSILKPEKTVKYLGFIFDSERQTISIPDARREKLFKLVLEFSSKVNCRIKDFASLIGSLNSVCPAVRYSPLYIKNFEREKFLALLSSDNSYSATMNISKKLKPDFDWWLDILQDFDQSNVICTGQYAREIFSDASLTGWGASCDSQRAHGWWSDNEKGLHINALEIKAAFYALKSFASDLENCEILVRVDNTTALSYLNRYGSVQHPHLSKLAREIWQWAESRNIMLFSSYIPSKENIHADRESRRIDTDNEWQLSDSAFRDIAREFGPFDVDLFATMLNAKCQLYISWHPDPDAWVIDAFTLSWENLNFYAFPPFILIPRVLRKIVNDKAEGTVVVPAWPSQSWFPLFHRLLVTKPLVLKPSKFLLSSPLRTEHPAHKSLHLMVGRLSGAHMCTDEYRNQRSTRSWHH